MCPGILPRGHSVLTQIAVAELFVRVTRIIQEPTYTYSNLESGDVCKDSTRSLCPPDVAASHIIISTRPPSS